MKVNQNKKVQGVWDDYCKCHSSPFVSSMLNPRTFIKKPMWIVFLSIIKSSYFVCEKETFQKNYKNIGLICKFVDFISTIGESRTFFKSSYLSFRRDLDS
jgi:hypothetical protein